MKSINELPRSMPALQKQLTAVPVRNQRISIEDTGRSLQVTVELKYPRMLQAVTRILKPRRKKTYSLEGLGRQLFEMVDDKSNLEQIIDRFAETHRLTFFEALAFVQNYLRTLMQRGIIVLALPARQGLNSKDHSGEL